MAHLLSVAVHRGVGVIVSPFPKFRVKDITRDHVTHVFRHVISHCCSVKLLSHAVSSWIDGRNLFFELSVVSVRLNC